MLAVRPLSNPHEIKVKKHEFWGLNDITLPYTLESLKSA